MLVSFLAGVLVGGAALFVSMSLWRRAATGGAKRLYAFAAAAIAAFALAALLLHLAVNARRSGEGHAAQTAPAQAAMSAPAPAAAPQSMDAEVARLEARLARSGGSDADWTLLAQAYDFLGRPDDARRARAKIASPASVAQMDAATLSGIASQLKESHDTAAPEPAISDRELEARTSSNPRDAESWLALADARRVQRDYRGALAGYEQAIALKAMNAQSWADYADTLASANGGSLSGGAGAAIDRALALDANNPKALWLKASQAHGDGRFADALTWWKKLRALLPAESSDARIIDGNIAEDAALLGGSRAPAQAASPAPASSGVAELSGTVSLDTHLANRVPADATLFIYAKAANAPGPPLAVMRTQVASWPVSFRLDDSMAMMPSRKLSQFDKVVVEARISRSGTAMPSSGDLYATSDILSPTAGKKLALVINHEIG